MHRKCEGLVCGNGNPETNSIRQGYGAQTAARFNNAFSELLRDCWISNVTSHAEDGLPNNPWNLTLPVVTVQEIMCRIVQH